MPPKKRQVMRKRPVRYDSDNDDSDVSEGDEFTTTRLADSERRGDVVVNKNPRYASEFSVLEMMGEEAEKAEERLEQQQRGGNVVRGRGGRGGRGDDSDDDSDDSTNNDYGAVRTRPYALRSRAARKPVVDYSSSSSSSSSASSSDDDDESQSSLSDGDSSSDSSSQRSLSDSDSDMDVPPGEEMDVYSMSSEDSGVVLGNDDDEDDDEDDVAAAPAPVAVVQEQEVVVVPAAQLPAAAQFDDDNEEEEEEQEKQQAAYQPTPAEEQEANQYALENVALYLGYKPDRAHLARRDYNYAYTLRHLKNVRLRQLQKAAERRAARGGVPSPPRKRPKPYVPTAEDKAKMDKLFADMDVVFRRMGVLPNTKPKDGDRSVWMRRGARGFANTGASGSAAWQQFPAALKQAQEKKQR